MDYFGFVQRMMQESNLMRSNQDFAIIIPASIDYAEQRMYRELDLLATRVTDSTGSLTLNSRNFTLPVSTGTFLVVESANVITPAGASAATGTRNPVFMTSREVIDAVFPINSSAAAGVPIYMAMISNTSMLFGPPAAGAYVVEIVGTQRPTPLSATNTTTILTTMLPDVFLAAAMVFMAQNIKNHTGTPIDKDWETEYQKLIASAGVEELRKKYQSQAWTSEIPNQIATPPRV